MQYEYLQLATIKEKYFKIFVRKKPLKNNKGANFN